VGEILWEVVTDFLAKLQATDVGHGPVGDDNRWRVLGVKFQRLASVFGEDDVVVVVRECVFDEFAINGGIIRYQDF
jgi:hypothetical protein